MVVFVEGRSDWREGSDFSERRDFSDGEEEEI